MIVIYLMDAWSWLMFRHFYVAIVVCSVGAVIIQYIIYKKEQRELDEWHKDCEYLGLKKKF